MESNCVQGKIFVGGISAETSEEILTQHFSRYGEVVNSQVILCRETGHGKGFGFVTFADSSVINQLLQEQHKIVGRTVDVNLAIPQSVSRQCQQFQRQNSRRKIFVGGLPPCLSDDDFKKYFEKFGRVEEVKLISDRETKTPRGFGFVTYASEESVTDVLQEKFHWLKNKSVEVKKAEPRKLRVMNTSNYYHNFYPSGYEMGQIYDCNNGIYAPHYWRNHTMVPNWISPFNHLGTNLFVLPQPVPVMVPYFTPRYPVNCYGSMHNQVDHNRGVYDVLSTFAQNDAINEGNRQDCNNIEVQVVANGSPPAIESAKPLEKETENGEKDHLEKIPQVNTKESNGEKDHLVKIFQVNTEDDSLSTGN